MSSSRPKPVRRAILAELESSREGEAAPPTGKSSTKDWVRRTFVQTEVSHDSTQRPDSQPETKRPKPQAPWYRATEEDAAIANEVISHTAKWAAAEVLKPQGPQATISEGETEASGARVLSGLQSQKKVGLSNGTEFSEAQQAEDSLVSVDQGTTHQIMGSESNFSPADIISPLKELVNTGRKISQRSNHALGVKKKIAHSPFHGNRIHKHIALATLEKSIVLADVTNPSSSKTDPDDGEISKEIQEPVVKEKPPADA
ncbi:hypothetical protein AALP_AAs68934U000500 [Arabis alpina]|uniref:Uncharacterized protein n=1 Tax=Arabis alpina TaxID=50452 RepID=A0A087FXU2_ARAAL|nr:hypothetical protein AALP_AAs68934U000500 [Arabis alpina]